MKFLYQVKNESKNKKKLAFIFSGLLKEYRTFSNVKHKINLFLVDLLDRLSILSHLLGDAYNAAKYGLRVVFDEKLILRQHGMTQRKVSILERLLDFECAIRSLANVVQRIERVLNAEHRRAIPLTIELLEHFFFGQVAAAVLYAYGRLHVVEASAVQLEEFDQQHAQIDLARARIDAGMQLQKADRHEYETVGADAACPHFVKVTLDQELFEDHDECAQTRILYQILFDELCRFDSF